MNKLEIAGGTLYPPATRPTDPSTSLRAEQRVTEVGKRQTDMERCVVLVRHYPGSTAGELAFHAGMERSEASKRLADARHKGLVKNGPSRRCTVKGSLMLTWLAS